MERKLQEELPMTFIDEVESKLEEEEMRSASVRIKLESKDSSLFEQIVNEKHHRLYRNLSEKCKVNAPLKASVIDKCIEAYQYLSAKGILTNLGANKQGIYYLVVYGSGYCRVQDPNEKRKVIDSFRTICVTLGE